MHNHMRELMDEVREYPSEHDGRRSTAAHSPGQSSSVTPADAPTRRFGKHYSLVVRKEEPFNAGPPLDLQRRSAITPVELFFVRNHGSVPVVDPETYSLSVTGLVKKPLELSLDDIYEDFPKVSVTATIQCAGNRRREMIEAGKIEGEVPWDTEAVSTAVWSGIRLRHVLLHAGLDPEAAHVAFTGLDDIPNGSGKISFGSSIPRGKAMSGETLLAFEMNGEPLSPEHGYPLRVVVPGYIGARSVKWIKEIVVRAGPSDNHFQANAYKLYAPWVTAETAELAQGEMLGEQRLNSVICKPAEGETVVDDVVVEGYAMGPVQRVEVSVDGGKSWLPASLSGRDNTWAWKFWETTLRLSPGSYQIVVRAVDAGSNTQPAEVSSIWNYKGYMNNAWHRVNIAVGDPE